MSSAGDPSDGPVRILETGRSSITRSVRVWRDPRRWGPTHYATVLAVVGAIATALVSVTVFPYHSLNHDEGVYLQQAAMLLDGQLFLDPPVDGSFRPWFFVDAGEYLYPKYSPVVGALLAVGKVFGSFRVALVGVSFGILLLTYRTVAEVFDDRTGLLAAGLVLASPLFLVETAVFLPYAPTTLFNLGFAAAYLHADRTGSRRSGAVAGLAIGVAFFARPFTAVLFAAPFVIHAVWRLRHGGRVLWIRQGLTAAMGLVGVGLTLWYNGVVTGDPTLFPYEAFAPLDGLGFGRRRILGHSIEYTPQLALRSNAHVLWAFATRWIVAGVLGTGAALVGFAVAFRRGISDRQAILAGLVPSIVLGNLYFWGTFNMLGAIDRRGDGLIDYLGPYYHFDLLVPTAAFAAVGVLWVVDHGRDALASIDDSSRRRRAMSASVVIAGLLAMAAGGGALAGPLAQNAGVTDTYERAYEPFEERDLENAVVFLPEPYGDWLNHPFQYLRNDPGFDGDVVYALRDRRFAVADAYPNRTLYRYSYRGIWAPVAGQSVAPRLEQIEVVEGDRVRLDADLGIPAAAERVSVRLASGSESAYGSLTPSETVSLSLTVDETSAWLSGSNASVGLAGNATAVPATFHGPVVLTAFVDYGTGAGFTYRFVLPVDRQDGTVRAISPSVEVCQGIDRCGGEAAYVPGSHREGIAVETSVSAVSDRANPTTDPTT